VENRIAKVHIGRLYAQVTVLAKNPTLTINTPKRWGKSLRKKTSRLGQIKQRDNRPPANASADTANVVLQYGQKSASAPVTISPLAVFSQWGQANVTFMLVGVLFLVPLKAVSLAENLKETPYRS
jgi:hypothetical protein